MFTLGQRVIATPMARIRFPNLMFGVYYTVCAVHQAKDTTYDIADGAGARVASAVPEGELRSAMFFTDKE